RVERAVTQRAGKGRCVRDVPREEKSSRNTRFLASNGKFPAEWPPFRQGPGSAADHCDGSVVTKRHKDLLRPPGTPAERSRVCRRSLGTGCPGDTRTARVTCSTSSDPPFGRWPRRELRATDGTSDPARNRSTVRLATGTAHSDKG